MPTRHFILLLSALSFTACSEKAAPPAATEDHPDKLTIAVAASMRYAFEDVVAAFEKQHPGVKIEATYGASGTFYTQVVQKAPFDLFLSADTEYPDQLVAEGHAKESFPYAKGQLVLWAPKTALLDVATRGMEALKDARVAKVSIANPDLAPYGRAAMEAIRHFQLDAEIGPKLVRAENVGQSTQFVQSGAAQIGLFAYSLTFAKEMKDQGDLWIVPGDTHEPLLQGGVILPGCTHPEAAAALRDFLTGPEGQAILQGHGFSPP